MIARRLADIDLATLTTRGFHPSPAAWEDQVLYFLLVDRFSDGREQGYRDNAGNVVTAGSTPRFAPQDAGNAIGSPDDAAAWRAAGARWVGGTLRGLTSKIGYLHRLGVTAIWISPVLKQVAFQPTYHGYGIQQFLDVEPHFGTREDLRHLVEVAHAHGIYVILDIILNHTGNVFGYTPDRYWTQNEQGAWFLDPRWDGAYYQVAGFHDASGHPSIPFGPVDLAAQPDAWPDGALWPAEFQQPDLFSRKGRITNWDYAPEYLEGDFEDLKDVILGQGPIDAYQPSAALLALCQVYTFWIAFADLDGFRVDTVKHMDPGATRFFTAVIHEFAQSLGKENFYLIGEITGGRRRAYETLEETGLDAALGIDDIPDRLEGLVKGYRDPAEYFGLFRNSLLVEKHSHVWFRNKVVTLYDDHDQVRKGNQKARFAAGGPDARALALNALALNATTLGIPCIYYGSEQAFDGEGGNDRYIREAMFGGDFGPFRSRGRHCFDEDGELYRQVARILDIRRQSMALRRGRQYLREISGDGAGFGLPRRIDRRMRSVVPWSRIFNDHEVLVAINTDPDRAQSAWVTVDDHLHRAGEPLTCLHSTDAGQMGQQVSVVAKNGKAVLLTVPPAGFVLYE
jgi:glycosidase